MDAALIFDWGIEEKFDHIILVKASKEKKIERLVKKGIEREKVLGILSAQKPEEEMEKKADIVIENNNSLKDLESKTLQIWKEIHKTL